MRARRALAGWRWGALGAMVSRVRATGSPAKGLSMSDSHTPSVPSGLRPVAARDVEVRARPSVYPAPFAARMEGRAKRQLGEVFGLKNFGVNLTELAPGAQSALMHAHTTQDEFVYVVEGRVTLKTPEGAVEMGPGDCVGFAAGGGAHHLVNQSGAPVVYLEIGDRMPGDAAHYPEDDLKAVMVDGAWVFFSKDGKPYA